MRCPSKMGPTQINKHRSEEHQFTRAFDAMSACQVRMHDTRMRVRVSCTSDCASCHAHVRSVAQCSEVFCSVLPCARYAVCERCVVCAILTRASSSFRFETKACRIKTAESQRAP